MEAIGILSETAIVSEWITENWRFLTYLFLWAASAVVVGTAVAYYLRRGRKRKKAETAIRTQPTQETALKALVEMLDTIERLSGEVGIRNTEITAVRREMDQIRVSGELNSIQKVILQHVTGILKSNQAMADELVIAQHRLEQQAVELDKSRREARTDPLAGVGNRKSFDEGLQWLLSCSNREGNSFVVILLDMDRFKWVNDTHGHQAGDRVLTQMGALLKHCVRGGDIVARFGGDEFAILLPRTDTRTGQQVAARLKTQVGRSSFHLGRTKEKGVITLSVGVTAWRPGDTMESIIKRADKALYKSKTMGRNRVYALTDESLDAELVEMA